MDNKINTYSCPDNRKDWKICVRITEPVKISLTYVPDKLITDHSSLKSYLQSCAQASWSNPEDMLLNIIEGVNNELIPKWLKVAYSHENVEIEIQDQQPGLQDFKSPA